MAWSFVTGSAKLASGSGNSPSVTINSTGAGNLGIVILRADSTSSTASSPVVGSQALTATSNSPKKNTNGPIEVYFYYILSLAGGQTTASATLTGNPNWSIIYAEFSSTGTHALDTAAGNPSSGGTNSGSLSVTSYTPTSGALIVGGAGTFINGGAWTAGAGFTIPPGGSGTNEPGGLSDALEYNLSASGATTVPFTYSIAADWAEIGASFTATAAGITTVSEGNDEQFFGSNDFSLRNAGVRFAEDWLPLVPQPPLFEWDESQRWQLNRDFRVSLTTGEEDTGFLPIIPKIVYDDDSSRSFETRSKQEDEPWHTFFTIPTPPPNLGWDDWDWSRDFSPAYSKPPEAEPFDFIRPIVPSLDWFEETQQVYGLTGLSALVALDEFVNAPAGSIQFGPAPLGRSARFGFSISAFR